MFSIWRKLEVNFFFVWSVKFLDKVNIVRDNVVRIEDYVLNMFIGKFVCWFEVWNEMFDYWY